MIYSYSFNLNESIFFKLVDVSISHKTLVETDRRVYLPLLSWCMLVLLQSDVAFLWLEYRLNVADLFVLYRDDEDFNDVATMGGVNLSEESGNNLTTNTELISWQSCEDEKFLFLLCISVSSFVFIL